MRLSLPANGDKLVLSGASEQAQDTWSGALAAQIHSLPQSASRSASRVGPGSALGPHCDLEGSFLSVCPSVPQVG